MARDDAGGWSVGLVEARLIAAFRVLPGQAVFSRRGRIEGDNASAAALNWAAEFVPDRAESLALLTWARCRAMGDSVRERYRELGWTRSRAERGRRKALQRIVNGLTDRGDKGT